MDDNIDKKDYLVLVHSFHTTMQNSKVALAYEGDVTHQVTKAFTSLTEASLEAQKEDSNVSKKVFHVMVECLQNVSKHAEELNEAKPYPYKDGSGVFLLSKNPESYRISTGNYVSKERIPNIVSQIEVINELDKEGLKSLYKQKIKEVVITDKGGAGLGLIDIAKKTGSKLEYQFIDVNEKYSYFIFSTQIFRTN